MSTPTPLEMVFYHAREVWWEDADLNTALYELNRALESPWPGDLPRAINELLHVVEAYQSVVHTLLEDIDGAGKEPEEESPISTNIESQITNSVS
jgi:hypothetical protein